VLRNIYFLFIIILTLCRKDISAQSKAYAANNNPEKKLILLQVRNDIIMLWN